jgi:hypothetical protein
MKQRKRNLKSTEQISSRSQASRGRRVSNPRSDERQNEIRRIWREAEREGR